MLFATAYRVLHNLAAMLAHLVCPPFCVACRTPLEERIALCTSCFSEIRPTVTALLPITKQYTMSVHAMGKYEGSLKQLILAKGRRDRVACYYMAQLIALHDALRLHPIDYITFIPLHWTRYADRGYNQAEEIAHALAKQLQVPVVPLLTRTKKTPFQSMFGKEGRAENVHDAFALKADKKISANMHNKHILIIDDLMTTGATLTAAANIIISCKPASIRAAVLARV